MNRLRKAHGMLAIVAIAVGAFPGAAVAEPAPLGGDVVATVATTHDHPKSVPASKKPAKAAPSAYVPGKPVDRAPCLAERQAMLHAKVASLNETAEGRAQLAATYAKIKADIMAGCD